MAPKSDPLVAALAELSGVVGGGKLKVDIIFDGRPQVLDAIRDARLRRPPASFRAIARLLTADAGTLISEGAVMNWCAKEQLP